MQGGNASFAWELAPDVVAYIGYSGGTPDNKLITALRDLAQHARGLTKAQWLAGRPQVVTQVNDFGGG